MALIRLIATRPRGRPARAHRPALWGAHHDLTGPVPMSWPEALSSCSAELGEPVTFRGRGRASVPRGLTGAGTAGPLSCSSRASGRSSPGENATTDTFQQITGRPAPGGRVPSRVPRGIRPGPRPRCTALLPAQVSTAAHVDSGCALALVQDSPAADTRAARPMQGARLTSGNPLIRYRSAWDT
jgi:hypothetical protein